MPTPDPMAFFDLGCQVTKYLHGIEEKVPLEAMLKVVKDIANGSMTLVDTPEEVVRGLDENVKALADNIPALLREMRADEHAAAKVIWDRFVEISEGR